MKNIRKGYKYLMTAGAVLFLLSGCISTPVTPQREAAAPALRVSESVAAKRKADLCEALIDEKIRGVVLYPASWKNYSVDDVISRVKSYNFNRIYFVITSEDELDERVAELIRCATREGVDSHIFLRQRDYYPRHRGNLIVRYFLPEYPQTADLGRIIREFADEFLGDEGKISGFTVLLEPHRFNVTEQRKRGIHPCFIWRDDAFGIGFDNDILTKKTLEDAGKLTASAIAFTPAAADFYHEWAAEGKLSRGRVNDFSALATNAPEVVLLMTGNKPTAAVAGVRNELREAKTSSVILLFAVADHLSIGRERFRRRNFTDFVKAVKYGREKLSAYPAKSGIITGPLRALEYMCYEEE
jgi:hypothetical protein